VKVNSAEPVTKYVGKDETGEKRLRTFGRRAAATVNRQRSVLLAMLTFAKRKRFTPRDWATGARHPGRSHGQRSRAVPHARGAQPAAQGAPRKQLAAEHGAPLRAPDSRAQAGAYEPGVRGHSPSADARKKGRLVRRFFLHVRGPRSCARATNRLWQWRAIPGCGERVARLLP